MGCFGYDFFCWIIYVFIKCFCIFVEDDCIMYGFGYGVESGFICYVGIVVYESKAGVEVYFFFYDFLYDLVQVCCFLYIIVFRICCFEQFDWGICFCYSDILVFFFQFMGEIDYNVDLYWYFWVVYY